MLIPGEAPGNNSPLDAPKEKKMKESNWRHAIILALGLAAFGGATASAQIPASGGRVDPDQLNKFGGTADPKAIAIDHLFLEQAYQGGLSQIQLAQLAERKAGSDQVKALARHLEQDHTDLNASLKQEAGGMGYKVPEKVDKKDAAEYKKLDALAGPAFDSEYLAYLAKAHKKDISSYQEEQSRTPNPAIRDTTAKGVAMMQAHLTDIQKASN